MRGRAHPDVSWLGRHQVTLYLVALAAGTLVGLSVPAVARPAEAVITPVIALLLYATFLAVPFGRIGHALRDRRFLSTTLVLNFAVVPVVVSLVSRIVVEPGPFVEALVMLVVVPLVAAGLTQLAAARTRWGRATERVVLAAMVPLMMLTLATVVASQISGVGRRLPDLLLAVPVYVLFAAVMLLVGVAAARVARLDAPSTRAVVFSGVTRNSLVILPLVLALPAAFDLAPLVVVTQTLVELVVMVLLVRLLPRVVPARATATT